MSLDQLAVMIQPSRIAILSFLCMLVILIFPLLNSKITCSSSVGAVWQFVEPSIYLLFNNSDSGMRRQDLLINLRSDFTDIYCKCVYYTYLCERSV